MQKIQFIIMVALTALFFSFLLVVQRSRSITYSDPYELTIPPLLTDPNMTDGSVSSPHYVYLPNNDTGKNNFLWIHFAGYTLVPSDYQTFGLELAKEGYLVLIPSIPQIAPFFDCREYNSTTCMQDYWNEIIFGKNTSILEFDKNPANTIENKIEKLLIYLEANYSWVNWGEYINTDTMEIFWNKIVLSGHSNGGSVAGFIAHEYSVARVVFFASPVEFNYKFNFTSQWISSPFMTPRDRFFGFTHIEEYIIYNTELTPILSLYLEIWNIIGLNESGNVVDIDSNDYPFNNSHQLITTKDITSYYPNYQAWYPHRAIIVDDWIPYGTNGNIYLGVWKYFMILPTNSPTTGEISTSSKTIAISETNILTTGDVNSSSKTVAISETLEMFCLLVGLGIYRKKRHKDSKV